MADCFSHATILLGIIVFPYTQTGKIVYPDAYMEHMYASVRHIYESDIVYSLIHYIS
jgi:hypothetical protein